MTLHYIANFVYEQFLPVPLPPSVSFQGQTVLITGANAGLGLEAARHCARRGAARIVLAARTPEKAAAAVAAVRAGLDPAAPVDVDTCRLDAWSVDLDSFASVAALCQRADAELDGRLDAVIANAGVGMARFVAAPDAGGFETTIAVNVLSTFYMAVLLVPLLRRTAAKYNVTPRLAIVGSDAYQMSSLLDPYKNPAAMTNARYNVSKLMVLLLFRQLANVFADRKIPITTNILHPGLCRTDIFRNMPPIVVPLVWLVSRLIGRTAEQGARTLVVAAAAGPETNGGFMSTCRVVPANAYVQSQDGQTAQTRLFDETMAYFEAVHPSFSKNLE